MPIPQIRHIIQQNVHRGDNGGFRHHHLRLGGKPSRPRFSFKQFLFWAVLTLAALFLAGSLAFVALMAWFAKDLPDPNNISSRTVAQTTRIYDRTGQDLLYEIHGDEKRTIVDLDHISNDLKNATIAVEDKNFYQHKGFDIKGYLRAIVTDIIRRGKSQGGSTITQQLVKWTMLTSEKTFTRKLKELILSIQIERRFTKDQILKMYLNEIGYGSTIYGIESAAQTFLGKPAADLTVSESALLAAIPQSPTYYSPFGSHQDALVARQHYIIDLMQQQGMISADAAKAAKADDVLARVKPKREAITAPHFVFYVRELLAEQFGEDALDQGGLKVITTLDLNKQQLAEKAVAAGMSTVKTWGGTTAAMMAEDPKTGEILAMVGSPDYFDDTNNGKFNSMLGYLQPGSSIKPFVYSLGFEKGYTPDTVLYDVTTSFENKLTDPYTPHDYDGNERGPVIVRQALAGSLNIPAVKMLYLVGVNDFLDFASQKLGYTTFNDRRKFGLSIVLGGGEVRPLEHINAFTIFPEEGLYRPAKAILRVEDNNGAILLDDTAATAPKRVIGEETARQISSILSDNAARSFIFGEKNSLILADRPVAAKTGTTQYYKDAWTIGYTPSLVAGVWVGRHDGQKMKDKADGSKVAAPIWNQFMREALAGTPVENFTAPQPVVTGKPVLDGYKNAQVMVKIDKITGKLATDNTPPAMVEERGFGVPHDILFFCDRSDPRGPAPEHPEDDPQFALWEKGVADWAAQQNITYQPPPTEYDDVHVPENVPTAAFVQPVDGGTVAERTFLASVDVQARRGAARVEFLMDNDLIATLNGTSGPVAIPNRFGKGFHVLTARAYDDVGNNASTSITINLTAPAGPIGIQWLSPAWNGQTLLPSQFPFNVSFQVDDLKSIGSLQLVAVNQAYQTETVIGSIASPVLPNFSMNWERPSDNGRYTLKVEATLASGDVRTAETSVYVAP